MLTGIVLRLIPYFLNRSLWMDEAWLSLNIIDRDFMGLMQPLDSNQVAPVLFLFIEKANVILFGNSEYSLRLFPLICGLLSFPLVYRFTKAISGNTTAALLSLFLFATSRTLIYYSTEVKQYENDVFCALCLLTLVFDSSFSAKANKRYLLLAIVGSVLIFMSNVTILVLFTIGIYYLFKYRLAIFRQRWLLVMLICWTIAFLVNYFSFIYSNPERSFMLSYWQNSFMPFQIFSAGYWVWMYDKIISNFEFYTLVPLTVFILSVIIFIVKRQWLFLYLILFPLLLHLIISGLKMYPFETRLILYLSAFIIPAIGIGIIEWLQLIKKQITKYLAVPILLIILVYGTIAQLADIDYPFGAVGHYPQEIKKSISFIASNISDGQKVYVYFDLIPSLTYYIKTDRVPFKDNVILGTDNWGEKDSDICFNDVSKLHGEVWLLFSPIYHQHWGVEEYTLKRLTTESHAVVLKTFKTDCSSAYLVKIN